MNACGWVVLPSSRLCASPFFLTTPWGLKRAKGVEVLVMPLAFDSVVYDQS